MAYAGETVHPAPQPAPQHRFALLLPPRRAEPAHEQAPASADTDAWAAAHADALCQRCEVSGETAFCYTTDAAPLLAHLAHQPGLRSLHRPANLEDVFLIANEMLEVDVEIDDALLDLIRKRSNGVVRTIVSALDKIEKMAMASDARIIRLEDVDASELLHDVRRSR